MAACFLYFIQMRAEYNEGKLTLAVNQRVRWDTGSCNLAVIYFYRNYSVTVKSGPKLLAEVGLNSSSEQIND